MIAAAAAPDPVAVAGLWVAIGAAVFTFGSVIVAVVALVNSLLNRPRPRLEVVGNISPVSSITYNMLDESGNVMESAHDVRFTMAVTNWGNGVAHDVRLEVFGGTPALLSREVKLGNLAEKGEAVPANLKGTWSSVNGTPRLILTWWQYPGPKQYRAFPPERGEFMAVADRYSRVDRSRLTMALLWWKDLRTRSGRRR
jgi:hypothetical protein